MYGLTSSMGQSDVVVESASASTSTSTLLVYLFVRGRLESFYICIIIRGGSANRLQTSASQLCLFAIPTLHYKQKTNAFNMSGPKEQEVSGYGFTRRIVHVRSG